MGGVVGAVKKIGGGIASAATGNPMGLVSGALGVAGGVSDLFGGGPKSSQSEQSTAAYNQVSQRQLGKATPEELALIKQQYGQLGQMGQQLGGQYNQAAQDYQQTANMFRDALTKFATGTLQPSPEQLAQATSFVDQTFTAPAELQYKKFIEQASDLTSRKAAAQGRSPFDSAISAQFTGLASEKAGELAAERGARIANYSDMLSFERPQAQLAALGQGAQFFNSPLQSAISNRLALLNAGTQQQNLALERQLQTGTTSNSYRGTGTGSLNKIGEAPSMGSRLSNLGGAISDFGKTVGPGQNQDYVITPAPGTTFGGGGTPSLGNFKLNY